MSRNYNFNQFINNNRDKIVYFINVFLYILKK